MYTQPSDKQPAYRHLLPLATPPVPSTPGRPFSILTKIAFVALTAIAAATSYYFKAPKAVIYTLSIVSTLLVIVTLISFFRTVPHKPNPTNFVDASDTHHASDTRDTSDTHPDTSSTPEEQRTSVPNLRSTSPTLETSTNQQAPAHGPISVSAAPVSKSWFW